MRAAFLTTKTTWNKESEARFLASGAAVGNCMGTPTTQRSSSSKSKSFPHREERGASKRRKASLLMPHMLLPLQAEGGQMKGSRRPSSPDTTSKMHTSEEAGTTASTEAIQVDAPFGQTVKYQVIPTPN
jgi:hypothetical protein